jgi:competence protein ComEC
MTEYDSKTFQSFKKYLEKQGKEIQVPIVGESFSLGSATVTMIGPLGHYSEPNNMSIVLRIQYGNTSFLFAGDAEIDSEQDILNAGTVLESTLLKVGHHGSDTSTSYRWLREIAPEYAVISVGKNNSYGHPAEQTLSRLRDADVTLFRTDLQGHIICSSDGTSLTFSVERNATADTFATENHVTTSTGQSNTTFGTNTSYVLNTNTYKFHYPHCSSVKQMAAKNRKDVTLPREEIIAMGYFPCGRCDP